MTVPELNLDDSTGAADWLAGWDIRNPDHSLVENAQQLDVYLESIGMTRAEFKKQRVYTRNLWSRPWLRDI